MVTEVVKPVEKAQEEQNPAQEFAKLWAKFVAKAEKIKKEGIVK